MQQRLRHYPEGPHLAVEELAHERETEVAEGRGVL